MNSKPVAQDVNEEKYEAPAIVQESTISTRAGSPITALIDDGIQNEDIFDQ